MLLGRPMLSDSTGAGAWWGAFLQLGSGMLADQAPQVSSVRLARPPTGEADVFPYGLSALTGLTELSFPSPVSVFVGENGSGKSTLLEAIALSARLPTIGSVEASADESLEHQRRLAGLLTLVWRQRTHRGFFLRAEDFFGFTRRLETVKQEMEDRIADVDRHYEGRSDLAKALAKGPAAGSIAAMKSRYGENLDANSHGESFLALFRSRFVASGLYLLDEPEAALSPQSQLGLVAMIRDMVEQGGQFLIATHSPILAAIPGATIYDFDRSPATQTTYDSLESVQLLRSFLEAPGRYLRHIWPD